MTYLWHLGERVAVSFSLSVVKRGGGGGGGGGV